MPRWPADGVGTPLQTGKVKFWKVDNGWGFIVFADREIFAHINDVNKDCANPVEGDSVTFLEGRDRVGRPNAKQIKIVT